MSEVSTDRGFRKTREGVIVSDKMSKTVVVAVVRQVMHKKYKKFIRRTSKYMAHNENNDAKVGDTVRIVETRPMSRLKRWRVQEIVRKASIT